MQRIRSVEVEGSDAIMHRLQRGYQAQSCDAVAPEDHMVIVWIDLGSVGGRGGDDGGGGGGGGGD